MTDSEVIHLGTCVLRIPRWLGTAVISNYMSLLFCGKSCLRLRWIIRLVLAPCTPQLTRFFTKRYIRACVSDHRTFWLSCGRGLCVRLLIPGLWFAQSSFFPSRHF